MSNVNVFLFVVQHKNYTDAEKIMKTILKAESGKRNDQSQMKESVRKAEIDKAFVGFSNACVDKPEFAMAYFQRGNCYMMMHDYKRALYDFSAAILSETRYTGKNSELDKVKSVGLPTFYMYGGQCNYYLGQYEEALAHYEIALNKQNSKENKGDNDIKSKIFYNRGLANASLNKYQDAIND